jgi:DNA-directed RNA polymerase specialized sigma24 family protein
MPTSSFSSSSVTEFEKLLDRLRRGDDDAAWQLVGEYGPHVTAVVRRMIRTQMRVRVDSQDLAQTVWKSFFLNIEEMTNVRTPEELIKTLVRVTQHKVQDAYRRQLYLARNGAMRERQLEAHDLDEERIPGSDGTPSQFAIVRERWQRMLSVRKPVHQEVLRRRMTGESFESIAASMGISERTARRVVLALWRRVSHDET